MTSSGDLLDVRRDAADMAAECRDTGIAGLLTYALIYLASAQALRGEFLDAMASAEEGLRIATDIGQAGLTGQLTSTAALLAAIAGDEEACLARVAQMRDLSASAQALSLPGADLALALLDLGAVRYQSALDRMEAVSACQGGATLSCFTPTRIMSRRRSAAGPIWRPGRWRSSPPGPVLSASRGPPRWPPGAPR